MIDLRKTLKKANMTQQEFSNEFGYDHSNKNFEVKKQNVGYWCNYNIPIKWYFKIIDFFAGRGIKIYYVKVDK